MISAVSQEMPFLKKLLPYQDLASWRAALPPSAAPLVVTNGCFDILHPGHVFLLATARSFGKTLLVGITGDAAIRILKGPSRPALPERDRLMMLCALEFVSHVCLFPQTDALEFLHKSRPHIYVKGGDYTLDTLNPNERAFLQAANIPIQIIPRFETQSTSSIVGRIVDGARDRR